MHVAVEYEPSRLKGEKEWPTPARCCKTRGRANVSCSNLFFGAQSIMQLGAAQAVLAVKWLTSASDVAMQENVTD